MFSPKSTTAHLKRLLPVLGVAILVISLLGLVLARLLGGGLTSRPLVHAALAVVAVLPILVVMVVLPMLASRFLREMYAIGTLREAFAFLSRLLFGVWRFGPYLRIGEGRVTRGEDTVLHRVGGPGFLIIYNDNVVVTEKGGRLERVLGAHYPCANNRPYLERFEKIWEIVDLRPQHWVLPVTAMTREGIPVVCEADVTFKIDDRVKGTGGYLQPKQPTKEEPYPFTAEAVLRAVGSRWVRDPDSKAPVMDWPGRVMLSFVEGTLRSILAEYRLDWLIAPTEPGREHPREAIRRRLDEQVREKAANVGAKVLRVDLGEIRVNEDRVPPQWVERQWIEAWQAEWEGRALATQVEGEAELMRMDIAQSKAKAQMVITLTQALQSVAVGEAEVRPYLLAARFVEALRWMSFDPYTRAFMPPEVMQTLKRLQDALRAPGLPLGEDAGPPTSPAEGA